MAESLPSDSPGKEERNKKENRQKYYRRNLIWQTIARLVREGLASEVAIGRIYGVYGYNSSTSKSMTAMVKDERRETGGLHPNLRQENNFASCYLT